MAASRDESKAVTCFVPSLLHCAAVKIAVPLFEEFGVKTVEEAFTEIQHGNLTTSEGDTGKIRKMNRAKGNLLHIPAHLRRRVVEAVHGSEIAVSDWMSQHSFFHKFTVQAPKLHWRSDGSVDAVKTARDLVRNTRFGMRRRFELACVYCLEDRLQAMWAEMEAFGKAIGYRNCREGVVWLWLRWLRERSRVRSLQSLIPSLGKLIAENPEVFQLPHALVPRFSVFFHLLRPEERQQCFHLLDETSPDDQRFCLYAIGKDEKELLHTWPENQRWLRLHLVWPLQAVFLETAEKLWDSVDEACFRYLLDIILDFKDSFKDFDYSELFDRFWNMGPSHWKERARESSHRIDTHFNESRRKRKICLE